MDTKFLVVVKAVRRFTKYDVFVHIWTLWKLLNNFYKFSENESVQLSIRT